MVQVNNNHDLLADMMPEQHHHHHHGHSQQGSSSSGFTFQRGSHTRYSRVFGGRVIFTEMKLIRALAQRIFLSQILFRVETSSVHLKSRKTDILQETINDLASKLIFFYAIFAIIDQF